VGEALERGGERDEAEAKAAVRGHGVLLLRLLLRLLCWF
jgi:hypothetical protein